MVGMDCCFTGGRTHCRLFEADGRERTVNDLAPETLGHGRDARGMSVMSNVQFLAYAELMEAMAREEKGASFVNVGGYGLLGSADGTAIKITSWREATGKERGDAS